MGLGAATFFHLAASITVAPSICSCYLSEDERLLVVGRVQSIVHHHASAKLFPDGVRWQSIHVDFNVGPDFLVREKLSWEHLKKKQTILSALERCWFYSNIICTGSFSALWGGCGSRGTATDILIRRLVIQSACQCPWARYWTQSCSWIWMGEWVMLHKALWVL